MKNKNILYYLKRIAEIIMIFIFFICLIGFFSSIFMRAGNLMGYSASIGLLNFLFMAAWEWDWRKYE